MTYFFSLTIWKKTSKKTFVFKLEVKNMSLNYRLYISVVRQIFTITGMVKFFQNLYTLLCHYKLHITSEILKMKIVFAVSILFSDKHYLVL